MQLLVLVRVKNERLNIERFCRNYGWADRILVADSGSIDGTVELAQTLPKVEVRHFLRKFNRGNFIDVPESSHTQFLIEWALEKNDDGESWLIIDDCDCWPNPYLKRDARSLFQKAHDDGYDQVNTNRLYIYKDRGYFPELNKAGTSMWGWRPSKKFVWTDGDESHLTFHGLDDKHFTVDYPYCLLHHSWPNEQVLQMKMERWRLRGELREDPRKWAGPLVPLPEFASELEG
jgi:glycosyltransferase involved in cell wall biosynthesis